jgi:hypothetical protein
MTESSHSTSQLRQRLEELLAESLRNNLETAQIMRAIDKLRAKVAIARSEIPVSSISGIQRPGKAA